MLTLKKWASWLMPYYCLLCGSLADRAQDLCTACYQDLPLMPPYCRQCGALLHGLREGQCGACLKNPPCYQHFFTLFAYQTPIPELLLGLKFNHALSHARLLGELFAAYRLSSKTPLPEVIIPVPLHKKRLKERGFNQSLECARPIAQRLQIPINTQAVIRCKPTHAQAELPAAKRKSNVQGAFSVQHNLQRWRIAVIDDVMTTGHTVREFCKTLKQHGAAYIEVWCISRSVMYEMRTAVYNPRF